MRSRRDNEKKKGKARLREIMWSWVIRPRNWKMWKRKI